MTFPINITYQGLPPSPALSTDIHRRISRLERFAGQKDQDVYVAAHEAIDVLRRQLEDFVRIRRSE